MYAPVTHILALTTIVRERTLPAPGQVVVRQGQQVRATDVIAEARLPGKYVLLDVARTLRVSPDSADRLIRCKAGDTLKAGTVVAQGRGGLFPRLVRAPRDGRVVAAGGGQVLLEVAGRNLELRAGIPGTVIEIVPERGAVIQTAGALIQGVWGNGRIDTGLMISLLENEEEVLDAARLDVSLRGSVLLGGHCRSADTLQAAADLPVRGLILSSITPDLIAVAKQMPYPIIVVDGFGRLPMNTAAYKLLTTNSKREVTLNAEGYDRYTGRRPEIVISLPAAQELPEPPAVETFAPDQRVRLRRAPHMGAVGTLVDVLPRPATLPNGLRAVAGKVRLENGEQILVPLVNLEVIG
ncbi:MAG: hypothetical protein D6770_01730 [Anaerolineae bacterium]|nr:MAG: hypothetical protein D6770_01730 [Anaerolineae bacterium]